MKLHLPAYLEGEEVEVELDTDGLDDNEMLIGWVNEYGTVTSCKANVQIADMVQVQDREIAALIINVDEFKKHLDLK